MRINNLIARFLVNKTTKEEWDTLDAWKQESQENLNELLEMQTIWKDSIDLKGYQDFDKQSAWDLINDQIDDDVITEDPLIPAAKKSAKFLNLRWAAGIAAAISIIVFSVFTMTTGVPEGYNRIAAEGIIENVTLPDGSEIFMNRNAELDYAVNFASRRDIILDGEAYFDVARDEVNPFTIKTDHADITVLGTSFNIEEKEDHVDVFVTSGKVKVVSGSDEVILTKDQMAQCKDGKITLLKRPSKNYLSWKFSKLEFNDDPLHLVVKDLSRHYNKKLSFASDSKAMNQPINDIFENEDFESVLETLVLITGIKYHKDGNNYVIE